MSILEKDSITFGKYKGSTLSRVFRDRDYCKWLLQQDWFKTNYEFLYNRINEYNPISYFITTVNETKDFLEFYEYFNLTPADEIKLELSQIDKTCYEYYLLVLEEIKQKVHERLENDEENPYDIKAPTNWLKRFEKKYGIQRSDFKEFLEAHDLLNIPYIIERVKKEGGIKYKGAESFNIAKSRSIKQEIWWENLLKLKYGEDICSQFKYKKCIFDFINISTKTIFECKLGMKDFDEIQHAKYRIALNEYRIIYLISEDCVIEMEKRCIYTTNPDKYQNSLLSISSMKDPSWFYTLVQNFDVIEVDDLSTLFGLS